MKSSPNSRSAVAIRHSSFVNSSGFASTCSRGTTKTNFSMPEGCLQACARN
jgi:hypothetical protein